MRQADMHKRKQGNVTSRSKVQHAGAAGRRGQICWAQGSGKWPMSQASRDKQGFPTEKTKETMLSAVGPEGMKAWRYKSKWCKQLTLSIAGATTGKVKT